MRAIKIGQSVTASIELDRDWVEYSDGDNGEKDYYRDVYVSGVLAYCDGEVCRIENFNTKNNNVTLSNDNIQGVFIIAYEHFKADFVV